MQSENANHVYVQWDKSWNIREMKYYLLSEICCNIKYYVPVGPNVKHPYHPDGLWNYVSARRYS